MILGWDNFQLVFHLCRGTSPDLENFRIQLVVEDNWLESTSDIGPYFSLTKI